MTGFTALMFLMGGLIGVLIGGAICVRFVQQEMAAEIGPRLRHLQMQLDNLEATVNLALMTRYAELSESAERRSPPPAREPGN
jgi:hypothetical protein